MTNELREAARRLADALPSANSPNYPYYAHKEPLAKLRAALTATTNEAAAQPITTVMGLPVYEAAAHAEKYESAKDEALSIAMQFGLCGELVQSGLQCEKLAKLIAHVRATQPVQAQGEAVAEVTHGHFGQGVKWLNVMPIPGGAKLYTNPAPAVDRGLSEAQELEAFKAWQKQADIGSEWEAWKARAALAASAPSQAEPSEFPAGAIVNGRTLMDRIEQAYSFECEAGPLRLCADWHMLRECFEHLANHAHAPSQAESKIAFGLNVADLNLVRQWYDSMVDTNPAYAEHADHELAVRVYQGLGMRVPHSLRDAAAPSQAGSCQASAAELTDANVDRLLSTRIPGGSQARDWFLPHEHEAGLKNVRGVVRAMLREAYALGLRDGAPPAGRTLTAEQIQHAWAAHGRLPTDAEHEECVAAQAAYFRNLNGAPTCWVDSYRAGWFGHAAVARAAIAASSTTAGERDHG